MHPEIAKRLIKKYASNDTIVFDPFMGSGVVLLEAVLHGHDAVGLDINPQYWPEQSAPFDEKCCWALTTM